MGAVSSWGVRGMVFVLYCSHVCTTDTLLSLVSRINGGFASSSLNPRNLELTTHEQAFAEFAHQFLKSSSLQWFLGSKALVLKSIGPSANGPFPPPTTVPRLGNEQQAHARQLLGLIVIPEVPWLPGQESFLKQ